MRKPRETSRIVIQKMLGYCDDIQNLRTRYDDSFERYVSDIAFRYACDMCILQIGELTTRLSDDFKAQHADVPWRLIKSMRNIHVHEYENVEFDTVWKTLTEDIPKLKSHLEKILAAEEATQCQLKQKSEPLQSAG